MKARRNSQRWSEVVEAEAKERQWTTDSWSQFLSSCINGGQTAPTLRKTARGRLLSCPCRTAGNRGRVPGAAAIGWAAPVPVMPPFQLTLQKACLTNWLWSHSPLEIRRKKRICEENCVICFRREESKTKKKGRCVTMNMHLYSLSVSLVLSGDDRRRTWCTFDSRKWWCYSLY